MKDLAVMDRRGFVTWVAATATTAAVTGGEAMAAAPQLMKKELDLKQVTPGTFRVALGQVFQVVAKEFVLESVSVFNDPNISKRPQGIRRQSFSLVFSANADVRLSPGIYKFSNRKLGRFTAYMNEVWVPSTFPTSSLLGQTERYFGGVVANLELATAKVYYEVPFN